MQLSGVFKFLNGVRPVAKPEETKVDVTFFDFGKIRATDWFGACACIIFPQPAMHFIFL